MRIVLTSHGSTGDIYPVIALGHALKANGHQVRFGSASLFRKDIERAGLEFFALPPDWDQEQFAECMRGLNRIRNPIKQLRFIYQSGLAFFDDALPPLERALKDADLLVCSFLTPYLKTLAQRANVPFAMIAFCHMMAPNTNQPPYPTPNWSKLPAPIHRWWNNFCWSAANAIIDYQINSVLKKPLARNGLPKVKDFFVGPADLILVAVSPLVANNIPDISPRYKLTGYMRWQAAEDESIEKSLTDFCAGSTVPVLTFGSVTTDHDASTLRRFLDHWPKDKKIIIQSGWAGFSPDQLRKEIKPVGKLSHDQLFKKASCVIHHGGAGTTSSALHAGKPHIVVPHIGDQPFWASEVKRLGVGSAINKRNWPEKLAERVMFTEQNQTMRSIASHLGHQLRQQDGPANAARILEDFVQIHQNPKF